MVTGEALRPGIKAENIDYWINLQRQGFYDEGRLKEALKGVCQHSAQGKKIEFVCAAIDFLKSKRGCQSKSGGKTTKRRRK